MSLQGGLCQLTEIELSKYGPDPNPGIPQLQQGADSAGTRV